MQCVFFVFFLPAKTPSKFQEQPSSQLPSGKVCSAPAVVGRGVLLSSTFMVGFMSSMGAPSGPPYFNNISCKGFSGGFWQVQPVSWLVFYSVQNTLPQLCPYALSPRSLLVILGTAVDVSLPASLDPPTMTRLCPQVTTTPSPLSSESQALGVALPSKSVPYLGILPQLEGGIL